MLDYLHTMLPHIVERSSKMKDEVLASETLDFALNSLMSTVRMLPDELNNELLLKYPMTLDICWHIFDKIDYKRHHSVIFVLS